MGCGVEKGFCFGLGSENVGIFGNFASSADLLFVTGSNFHKNLAFFLHSFQNIEELFVNVKPSSLCLNRPFR